MNDWTWYRLDHRTPISFLATRHADTVYALGEFAEERSGATQTGPTGCLHLWGLLTQQQLGDLDIYGAVADPITFSNRSY